MHRELGFELVDTGIEEDCAVETVNRSFRGSSLDFHLFRLPSIFELLIPLVSQVFTGALSALAVMTVLSAAMGFALPNLIPRK